LQAVFKNVAYVGDGKRILPFLKGSDFKNLDPLRIAAAPNTTLDVVVAGSGVNTDGSLVKEQSSTSTPAKELSLKSLQKALPDTPQRNSGDSQASNPNTVRRNPACGSVEVAMENYTHVEIPYNALPRRGLQTIVDDTAPTTSGDTTEAAKLDNKSQLRAHQEQGPPIMKPLSYTPSGDQPDFSPQQQSRIDPRVYETIEWTAKSGSKEAQVALGDMYKDGQGVAQDYQVAMKLYLRAAEQKHPVGLRKVGVLYAHGLGVTQNYTIAMGWFLKATEQGNPPAFCNIGFLYEHGQGVPQDYAKAIEWCRKAADLGHSEVQQNIGWMYQNSLGVPQNYSKAMACYIKADYQGAPRAACNIGYMYEHGLGVAQDDVQAVSWYRKAAEQGDWASQFNLGLMYSKGRGVVKDKAKAMELLRKSADQGFSGAKKKN
ncbi:hypothetical protein BG015_005675, partial [Linnemannia schmuckeri]